MLIALIASDSAFAVDVYVSRELAEQALAQVLEDEPDFEELLSIIVVDPTPFALN